MDSHLQKRIYNHDSSSSSSSVIKNQQSSPYQPPPLPSSNNGNGFPILAIGVVCIMATAFLLVTYYILVTKCCLNWQELNPLRRFSFIITRTRMADDPLIVFSPSPWQVRGLDQALIREIPIVHYTGKDGEVRSLSKCVVCLTEFQEHDTLRLLPNCNHGFHLDCIDIWLQNNANCPLCRMSISGAGGYKPTGRLIAPTSSPQDPQPFIVNNTSLNGSDEDFVVIELGEEGNELSDSRSHSSRKKRMETRKSRRTVVSSMGDECIDHVREKDDQFLIQPIRRSFSMDSAVDRHIYLSVQEIIQQNESVRNYEESSSRVRRPLFSFGNNGRGSRSAVLPIEF